jgi:hypothetical protein
MKDIYRKIDGNGNHYLLELNRETKELEWVKIDLKSFGNKNKISTHNGTTRNNRLDR